jgi:YfiH family protein
VIRWAAPGPYEVAFSTRTGGVSTGPYESLNLGLLTQDDPRSVAENRRRLCAEVGADPTRTAMPYQRHGAVVTKADPRGIVTRTSHEPCDALWSDEPGQAMLVITADCLPLALAREAGPNDAPALAIAHVGWRGLLAGIVSAATRALGGDRLAAVIGPGIGPCCYEVNEDVSQPFRARFGSRVVRNGKLDLWGATEQALREAGVRTVERLDLCTFCHPELFFSHRRDRGITGRQGLIGYVTGDAR